MAKIEIDLEKLERGTHIEQVRVTRGGKTFYRKQRVGRKENESGIKQKGSKIVENLTGKLHYHLTDEKDFKPNVEFEQVVQEFGRGLYITEKSNIGFWEHQMQGREYAVPIDISKLKIVKEENLPTMSEMAGDLKELGYTGKDIAKLQPKAGTINRKPFEIAVKRTWAKEAGFQGIIPKTVGAYSTEQLVIFDLKGVDVGKPESTYELRLREKMY